MNSAFSRYAKYYDLLYVDKKYEEEARYISFLLKKNNIKATTLLELGSGTGKHARALVEEGFQVTGIELSQEMVDEAKRRALEGFICHQGDICKFSLNEKYDAIISLFHVISYITSNEALNQLFKNVSDHLEDNGLFLFDFWYGPAVLSQGVETRVRRIKDSHVEITRIAESTMRDQDNCVDVNYTILISEIQDGVSEKFSELHTMRYFSLLELDLYAERHGLKRVLQEEFLTRSTPSKNTWGVCVAYRKVIQ
jgi:SAM-dependent methyltransferase